MPKSIIRNIEDQSQSEALVEYGSALDMKHRVELQQYLPINKKITYRKKIALKKSSVKISQFYGQYLIDFGLNIGMSQKQVTKGFWTIFYQIIVTPT